MEKLLPSPRRSVSIDDPDQKRNSIVCYRGWREEKRKKEKKISVLRVHSHERSVEENALMSRHERKTLLIVALALIFKIKMSRR